MSSPENTSPVLSVRDLEVDIATKERVVYAVDNVSFDVGAGEIVGVVGESGCGKSTMLRSLIGLHPSPAFTQRGSVRFEGRELGGIPQSSLRKVRGRDIGFISQSPFGALNPILSVEKQFGNVIRAHTKASNSQVRERALRALSDVGIAGPERVLDGYAHELSGGMAQRVVIAMAVMHNPKLILADEPTTALDVTVQRQILDLISSMIVAENRSMLLVTHDLGVVAQYCQRVIVMYAGKPVEIGAVEDVFVRPRHPYTAALLESIPRANQTLVGLTGSVQQVTGESVGCPYAPRCARAQTDCFSIEPPLAPSGDRTFACHHPIPEGAEQHVVAPSR